MKKSLVNLAMCLAVTAAAWAQSSTSQDTKQSTTSQAQSQASSSGQDQIEGCIVKQQTGYYIQPVNGGQPTALNAGGQDLSQHVGKHVNVTGTKTSSSSSSSAMGAQSSSGASTSKDSGDFLVTRVDVLATTCDVQGAQGQGTTKNH